MPVELIPAASGVPAPRRRLLTAAGAVAAGWLGPRSRAGAQTVPAPYPQRDRTIRLVLGVSQGGSLDSQARIIAQAVSSQTGATVEVENRPGTSFIETAEEVSDAEPDGYTLLYAPSALFAQNPHTLANLSYDPFTDFTPITLATRGPTVLTIHASKVPATNVVELIDWARSRPGQLIFGSLGPGSTAQLYARIFARITGIEISIRRAATPAEAIADLLDGRTLAFFDSATTAMANARTGRVRMLAVALPERNRFLPQVPTLDEQGVPGLDLPNFTMISGPARFDPRQVLVVNEVFVRALSTQSVVDTIALGAFETIPTTPARAATELRIAYDRWGEVIERIGYRKQPISG